MATASQTFDIAVSGGGDRFDTLSQHANCHDSFALRSQAEIDEWTNGSTPNTEIVYDAGKDAAKVIIRANKPSCDNWVGLGWAPIDKNTGHSEVSVQWEVCFDQMWLGDVQKAGLKMFQIAKAAGGDARRLELQARSNRTGATAVTLPTFRAYHNLEIGGAGISDPLTDVSDGYHNWQPGGDTKARYNANPYDAVDHLGPRPDAHAFLFLSPRWIRITVSLTFDEMGDGKQRLRVYMSDEETPSTLVIADPDDRDVGFLLDSTPDNSGSDGLFIQYNSSTHRTGPELWSWVRNVLVFKDQTVPLE